MTKRIIIFTSTFEAMKQITFIFLLFISLLSCKGQVADALVLRKLAAKETTVIVDVRTPEEYSEGHLNKAVNIPLPLLSDSTEVLKKYENVIVICKSGGRAGKAKKQLEESGFTNVYNGGGWQSLKAVLDEETVTDKPQEKKSE